METCKGSLELGRTNVSLRVSGHWKMRWPACLERQESHMISYIYVRCPFYGGARELYLLEADSRYPDLFQSQPAYEIPASLTTTNLFTIVNSCATLYHTSASRLSSIQDLAIPSADACASLIELNARLARVGLLQDAQFTEIADIRSRSVALIERWYQICVLSGGECWADWERRVGKVERDVRRLERLRTREENALWLLQLIAAIKSRSGRCALHESKVTWMAYSGASKEFYELLCGWSPLPPTRCTPLLSARSSTWVSPVSYSKWFADD